LRLDFQDIELKDAALFMDYWELTDQRASDYSFPILWGWASDYGYQAAADESEHLFWIRQTTPALYNLAPIGNWHHDDWGSIIRERYGNEPEFWLVPERLLLIWQEQFKDRIEVEGDRGNWEYLYDIRELATLAGNRYMRKRNRVNKFCRTYNYTYRPITQEIIPAVMDFQDAWCRANKSGHVPGLVQENHGIQRILRHWDEIPNLRGGVIEIKGRIVAYTIGELAYDMIVVHFEKASLEYKAAYQAINKEFLSHMLEENPGLVTVNREEDMNDPGLRDAKMSYLPKGFIKKFRVKISL
jgi:hypothetical protein